MGGRVLAFSFYPALCIHIKRYIGLLLSLLLNMMDAAQSQCAGVLLKLAEALAADFVRGGTGGYSQATRLMEQAFPDAPALRCERMPVLTCTCPLCMNSVRVLGEAHAATGVYAAWHFSRATSL